MAKQTDLFSETSYEKSGSLPSKEELLGRIRGLVLMHQNGLLGGERMPEDANPGLDERAAENYLFFTLPMALNYQRNSYALWPAATKAYNDPATKFVFNPSAVCDRPIEETRAALLKYKVALQPIKHTETWTRLCRTFCENYGGDVRSLIRQEGFSIAKIKAVLQQHNKAGFPYLSGQKICNYWLYVLEQYTDARFVDRGLITIAPDTHVMQASFKLGLLPFTLKDATNVQELVATAWSKLLDKSEFVPIDIHTPLWLWSRKGFPDILPIRSVRRN